MTAHWSLCLWVDACPTCGTTFSTSHRTTTNDQLTKHRAKVHREREGDE